MQNHIVDSQAADAPCWLKGAGTGYSRCSKCSERIPIQSRHSHEKTCWVIHNEEPIMRPSLIVSGVFSSESYSSSSLSMSDSISFEYSDIEDSNKLEFSYTTEDVTSFVCTMHQTLDNKWNGLKPYTVNFSTEDSDAAIEWVKNELRNGGQFEIEDRPTGKYIKAYFTSKYDEIRNNYEEMIGVLVHDVLTALQRYGVDISSVRYVTGVQEDIHAVYMMLPDYCMESIEFYSFQYEHIIRTENDLIGFVRKGTPIIPKDICDIVEDDVVTEKRFECGELLVRKFLYANIERLMIDGEYFTLKDMEDSGIIAIYRQIYKHDDNNKKLGRILANYCNNTKLKASPNIASNQRRRYRLKKDMIKSLLE